MGGVWMLWLMGCAGTDVSDGPVVAVVTEEQAAMSTELPHAAHAKPSGHGGPAGHHPHAAEEPAADGATTTHRFDDVDKWVKVFDNPERDAWQLPEALVGEMALVPGSVVADIGAGTGYFNPYLSRAVGSDGVVIAVDVEQGLVDHMIARAVQEATPNVKPRLGAMDDPGLKPAEVDVVLLVDTYHHIDGRVDYFDRLGRALKPGGRLVVVDFKPGELPVGPPPDHKLSPETVTAELISAGWALERAPEILPHQFVHIYSLLPTN